MATQKQHSFGTRSGDGERTGERPARRLRLQIEALEARIAPDATWDDDPVGLNPPPPDPPPPDFP